MSRTNTDNLIFVLMDTSNKTTILIGSDFKKKFVESKLNMFIFLLCRPSLHQKKREAALLLLWVPLVEAGVLRCRTRPLTSGGGVRVNIWSSETAVRTGQKAEFTAASRRRGRCSDVTTLHRGHQAVCDSTEKADPSFDCGSRTAHRSEWWLIMWIDWGSNHEINEVTQHNFRTRASGCTS